MKSLGAAILIAVLSTPLAAQDNLILNGGFEQFHGDQPSLWSNLWMREPGAGQATLDPREHYAGRRALRIEYQGQRDWSISAGPRLTVRPGDRMAFSGWAKSEGPGSSQLCVITYDPNGAVVEWAYGSARIRSASEWSQVTSSFIIPRGVTAIQPRIIGFGEATARWDEVSLVRNDNVFDLYGVPDARYRIANDMLALELDTESFTFEVTDKRNDRTWPQAPLATDWFVTRVNPDQGLHVTCLAASTGQTCSAHIQLETESPEVIWTLAANGPLAETLEGPAPFVTARDTYLVLPMNEGISVPVDDPDFEPFRLYTYGGHGLCMAFWGATDGNAAYMAIVETPDDAAVQLLRYQGLTALQPQWESQMGQFGPTRRLRYVFFDRGGHVAMCKRYRRYQQARGQFITLAEKMRDNPHVDLLIGAVNVWNWDSNPLQMVPEMQAAGIQRILWSRRADAKVVKALNQMEDVLTSRYDIYQDLMDPNIVATKLWGAHRDWTQSGWPDDLMLDAQGGWRKGWRVRGKDGNMYPCGVLCDRQALHHAQHRVPRELRGIPYRCRFIDTTTASPWRECYHPGHPLTRSDSRQWKMELLRYMSEEMHLVTGSETGHDAAVPYVHYFEGMMSLGPFRVPDAGRDMVRPWYEIPERVAKYQLGHDYRLPLWELVYHDCVVAQWYWGDYNNKLPALWDKRDRFNALYGTPPMFMFTKDIWQQYRDRFIQSYLTICPLVRRIGYAEMTDHRFLTPNRSVQQTQFENGIKVFVNFGTKQHILSSGKILAGGEIWVVQ